MKEWVNECIDRQMISLFLNNYSLLPLFVEQLIKATYKTKPNKSKNILKEAEYEKIYNKSFAMKPYVGGC